MALAFGIRAKGWVLKFGLGLGLSMGAFGGWPWPLVLGLVGHDIGFALCTGPWPLWAWAAGLGVRPRHGVVGVCLWPLNLGLAMTCTWWWLGVAGLGLCTLALCLSLSSAWNLPLGLGLTLVLAFWAWGLALPCPLALGCWAAGLQCMGWLGFALAFDPELGHDIGSGLGTGPWPLWVWAAGLGARPRHGVVGVCLWPLNLGFAMACPWFWLGVAGLGLCTLARCLSLALAWNLPLALALGWA